MSENITHTAVVDDCARLAIHSPAICSAFKQCFEQHLEIARLGGVTRSADSFSVQLFGRYRDVWPGDEEEPVPQKLAFLLGWICHRAADRQMKPVFRGADPGCPQDPTDCSVYHDVFVFREVYDSGRAGPYSPATLEDPLQSPTAAGACDTQAAEELMRVLFQRALLELHTFIPEPQDIEKWLERLIRLRQRFYVDIARYAKAFTNPDSDKVKRFITATNFYDHSDAIIRLARSIQRGEPEGGIDLNQAVEAAADQSQYAQALRKGYLYVAAASNFFEGRIDAEALSSQLDIGRPGG
jgi:hypothetical protein